MKNRITIFVFLICLISLGVFHFNGCKKMDAHSSLMGIPGTIWFTGQMTADTPSLRDIPPQKWRDMIATDIHTLQAGSSTKNKGTIYVASFHPQGQTRDVAETDEIAITFSEPVAPLKAAEKNAPSLIEVTPSLKGEGYWKSSTTYAFRIDQKRKPSTRYEVRFNGYTAFSGKPIAEKKWSFTTPRISIVHSYPYNDDKWQTPDQRVIVQFSQDVDPEKIAKFISIATPSGYPAFSARYATKDERKLLYYGADTDKNTQRYIVVVPTQPLPLASNIEVTFLTGLPPKEGNVGLPDERVIRFRTYEIFGIASVSPTFYPNSGIEMTFTNPVKRNELTSKLTISPSVKIDKGGDYPAEYAQITGKFVPGKTYTVTFPADLQDQFGNKLGTAKTFTAKCLDYLPILAPPDSSLFVLEHDLSPDIPVNVTNVFHSTVYHKPLSIPDLRALYDETEGTLQPSRMDVNRCATYEWTIPVKKNHPTTLGFDLNRIDRTDPGFYFVKFANATARYHTGHVIQLTDIALVAKYSPTQIFLIPFHMKTGNTVPNLTFKIEDFNPKNTDRASLGQVKGNDDGIAVYQPDETLLETTKLEDCFVFSEPKKSFIWGKKFEMLDMWNFYSPDFQYNYEPQTQYNPLLTFTDKYLYKGGQTVKFKGILRQIFGGPMKIPRVKRIDAQVFDSRGQSVTKLAIAGNQVTAYGSFAGEFNLPATAPTGFYRIDFQVELEKSTVSKSLNFSVQEYKPSQFDVTLAFDQQTLISGQPFSGTLSARYLFGTPMKGAEGTSTWTTQTTFVTPEGWDAYTFGTSQSQEMETIHKQSFTLDNEGKVKFGRTPMTVKGQNSVMLTVHGEVKDKDNNRIAAGKSIILHRGEYYIGVKTGSYFFKQDKPGKLQVVTVSPQGKSVPNTELHLKITREEWKSFQQKDASGALRWEWKKSVEPILDETLSLPEGTLEKDYQFNKPGFYQATLQGKDKFNNTITTTGYFYVTGTGYVSWGVNEGRTIDIVTDKKKYKPGENIEVLIKSPFETATALVTAEREQVIWSRVVRLKGNANTVQVPVQKNFMPNVYINVIILKERTGIRFDENGLDIGKPEFYAGYKQVNIDSDEKKLKVEIMPNRKSYEPGNKVKLDIKVTDYRGMPVKSELCLSVVDKGVLNLVGYQLPNPFDFFWANRPLDVKTVSTFNDILGRKKFGEKGENPGGDGGGAAFGSVVVRKNFKESAFYTAFIVTDNKGKAQVTFQLPDNLTTFKAMAVAGTIDDRFGSGSNDLLVKKNLILKPAVPDFIRPGDRFKAGVTVTNNSEEKLKVSVEVSSQNIRREKGDKDVKKLSLNPGETQPVWYTFDSPATGAPVKLTFKAIGGDYTDGLYQEIPVRRPQLVEAVANFGRVDQAPVKEQFVVPSGTLRELDRVEITLASSAMVGVKRHFDLLQEYPYECLEQRISKIYPFVGAGDFLLTYQLLDVGKPEIDRRVNELLTLMPQYQSGGGFKYYPDSCCTSPYLTCYAAEFLLDARAHGYAVDATMVKDAEAYLRQTANMAVDTRYPYSRNVWFLVQSYAAYVLARDHVLMKDAINNLFEVRDRIPLSGLAFLVKALDLKNDLPAYMQPVLAKTMVNKMKDEATTTHFENQEDGSFVWVHESNVKTTAEILDAFLRVYGKFPYAEKIARWLANTTNQKRDLSTQDRIRLFLAFATYYRTFEQETPGFVAEVLFNGASVVKDTFNARELTARTHTVPLAPYAPGETIQAAFQKQGGGTLYYLFRMTYAPAGNVEAMDRGFRVEKTYKKLDGTPVGNNTNNNNTNIFEAGEKYLVEVTVHTTMERSFVMLSDPIPAGLKVVNPNFETSSAVDLAKTTRDNEWNAYWGKFYRSEIYFDRIDVFADYLRKGTHTWKYLVIATNAGNYAVPPTVVTDMYHLDVFGRNANRNVQVK
ncbi:MAG: alpha-2-macroglobulin family protein [Candidatus Omnitrophota bacterium]